MESPAQADVCRSFKRSEYLFGPENVSAFFILFLYRDFECVAFERDAVYVCMESPAQADVCRFFTRSEYLFGPESVSAFFFVVI